MARLLRIAILVLGTLTACLGGGSSGHAAPKAPACDALIDRMEREAPGPTFLASYPQAPAGPLGNAAFLYDNAAAAIALHACGRTDLARRIGDAMVLAQNNDRFWHDGRLRNAYAAGPVGKGPVKLPGWWDNSRNMWIEDRYQVASDNGNMAWAALALLTLSQGGGNREFVQTAARIGEWTANFRDGRGPGGFKGGVFGHEPDPSPLDWKSTEHNTDLYGAYSLLFRATGNQLWKGRADVAAALVAAMWSDECACYATGTAEDGTTFNRYQALDAQGWPPLAIPAQAVHADTLWRGGLFRLRAGKGYAYSQALEGMWTEGTAQIALFAALFGQDGDANALLTALETMRAPDGGYYAADVAALPTGFMLQTDPGKPRQYFRLSHLGATAWAALAQTKFNPFTGTRALP